MNCELKKLVDYALVDGHFKDKEKQVLFKRAQDSGFDIDELEMMLDGKLHEINKTSGPRVNKCPSCREIMSSHSKVCPSCDYVLNSESIDDSERLEDAIKRFEDSVYSLKAVPKHGVYGIFNTVILIIITGGLYIIYKKLIKKESLFDRYAPVNERVLDVTEAQIRSLQTKYGDDQKISGYISKLTLELARQIKNLSYGSRDMEDKVDEIISKYIDKLIIKKNSLRQKKWQS